MEHRSDVPLEPRRQLGALRTPRHSGGFDPGAHRGGALTSACTNSIRRSMRRGRPADRGASGGCERGVGVPAREPDPTLATSVQSAQQRKDHPRRAASNRFLTKKDPEIDLHVGPSAPGQRHRGTNSAVASLGSTARLDPVVAKALQDERMIEQMGTDTVGSPSFGGSNRRNSSDGPIRTKEHARRSIRA